jgi:hypothetical protein
MSLETRNRGHGSILYHQIPSKPNQSCDSDDTRNLGKWAMDLSAMHKQQLSGQSDPKEAQGDVSRIPRARVVLGNHPNNDQKQAKNNNRRCTRAVKNLGMPRITLPSPVCIASGST